MNTEATKTGLQLRSLITSQGELKLYLEKIQVPVPAADEVVVQVEATPINPSDVGVLLGPADISTAQSVGSGAEAVVTATVANAALQALAGRLDESQLVGIEGAGLVVAAGASRQAQALLGKTVAFRGGGMYATWRAAPASDVVALPAGATAAQGASFFVNPLTALAMVETMRREGHKALVHTAAASNLGQMLNRICLNDGIDLVNIVRRAEQEQILRDLGARWVLNSNAVDFTAQLTDALAQTGATLAFDATYGGPLTDQILTAMEAAASRNATQFNRYGSSVYKQVYIYGGLDRRRFELGRSFGLQWGIGGFLLPNFLEKVGPDVAQRLRERVLAELTTTFASHYTDEISLSETLDLDVLKAFSRQATGKKYLINPSKALHGDTGFQETASK